MTATPSLRSLKAGDTVRVIRIGYDYAGPGTAEFVTTAVVTKVLSKAVRVAWGEGRDTGTTDFTRDSGKPVGNRRWINYPMIEAA